MRQRTKNKRNVCENICLADISWGNGVVWTYYANVLASQLFPAITQTTWFGYKMLYFTKFNAFIAPTMSFITSAQKQQTVGSTDRY